MLKKTARRVKFGKETLLVETRPKLIFSTGKAILIGLTLHTVRVTQGSSILPALQDQHIVENRRRR